MIYYSLFAMRVIFQWFHLHLLLTNILIVANLNQIVLMMNIGMKMAYVKNAIGRFYLVYLEPIVLHINFGLAMLLIISVSVVVMQLVKEVLHHTVSFLELHHINQQIQFNSHMNVYGTAQEIQLKHQMVNSYRLLIMLDV